MILPPKFDDSCVLWLDFASVKNNTVYDQSGNDNHGTIYGATHIGRFGLHGLHFDGVDDHMVVNVSSSLPADWCASGRWTAIFLVKPQTSSTNMNELLNGRYHSPRISIMGPGAGVFLAVKGPDGYSVLVSIPNIEYNKVHFIAAGQNIDADISFLYLDTRKATGPYKQSLNVEVYEFFYNDWEPQYFRGDAYFVALYNRALSPSEIKELYYYLTKGIRSIVPSRFVARAMR